MSVSWLDKHAHLRFSADPIEWTLNTAMENDWDDLKNCCLQSYV